MATDDIVLCKSCGHRAGYHGETSLSCRFETDRYEICTCDELKIDKEDLKQLVKWDAMYMRYR